MTVHSMKCTSYRKHTYHMIMVKLGNMSVSIHNTSHYIKLMKSSFSASIFKEVHHSATHIIWSRCNWMTYISTSINTIFTPSQWTHKIFIQWQYILWHISNLQGRTGQLNQSNKQFLLHHTELKKSLSSDSVFCGISISHLQSGTGRQIHKYEQYLFHYTTFMKSSSSLSS